MVQTVGAKLPAIASRTQERREGEQDSYAEEEQDAH